MCKFAFIYNKLQYDLSWPRMVMLRLDNDQFWLGKGMRLSEITFCRP